MLLPGAGAGRPAPRGGAHIRRAARAAGLGVAAAGLAGLALLLLHLGIWRGPPRLRVEPQPPVALSLAISPAAAVYRRVGPSVVLVGSEAQVETPSGPQDRTAWGSGVIFDPRGYIVTNAHVVDGATRLRVVLADGAALPATLVGSDPSTDLAVVRVDAGRPLPAAVFGDSDTVRPGELAVAIGNPLGPQFAQTVTQGVVSAIRPMLYGLTPGSRRVTEMIQTDAAINPGSSGGPLLNAAGEVIGIASVKVAQAQPGLAASGLGFAIPANVVRRVVDDLVRYGHVRRAWLGVSLEVSPPTALPGEAQQVRVAGVAENGPAARAGLRAGDRLLEWDGHPLVGYYDFILRLNAAVPGQRIRLLLERDGHEVPAEVVLGEAAP